MAQSNAARQGETEEHQPSERAERKPVDKFHDGPVHVSIWENAGPKGAFRTASFQLRYKDKQEPWQTGYSHGASDLGHLEKAAKEARDRINSWQGQHKNPAPWIPAKADSEGNANGIPGRRRPPGRTEWQQGEIGS